MRRYTATGFQTPNTTTYKGILQLTGAVTFRFGLYDAIFSTNGTPADNDITYGIQRTTADGTDTAVTPAPLDPADPVSLVTAGEDNSGEPTDASIIPLLEVGVHQRATFRWAAAPGGEIIVAAVANEGLSLQSKSSGFTGNSLATAHWQE
jgi:hypothetical protein